MERLRFNSIAGSDDQGFKALRDSRAYAKEALTRNQKELPRRMRQHPTRPPYLQLIAASPAKAPASCTKRSELSSVYPYSNGLAFICSPSRTFGRRVDICSLVQERYVGSEGNSCFEARAAAKRD